MELHPIDAAKNHPYLFGGVAVVAVVAYFALTTGGSAGASAGTSQVAYSGPSDASIAAGVQMQTLNAQLQSHQQDIAAATEAQDNQNAANFALAQLEYAYRSDADTIAKDVALAQIDASKDSTALQATVSEQANTLAAQVAIANTNAQVTSAQISAASLAQQSANLLAAQKAAQKTERERIKAATTQYVAQLNAQGKHDKAGIFAKFIDLIF